MLTPSRKGAIAETAFAAHATRLGFDVYRPVVEGGRFDLILDVGTRLLRVQCKTGPVRERCRGVDAPYESPHPRRISDDDVHRG
jgi:hypothetical protein